MLLHYQPMSVSCEQGRKKKPNAEINKPIIIIANMQREKWKGGNEIYERWTRTTMGKDVQSKG